MLHRPGSGFRQKDTITKTGFVVRIKYNYGGRKMKLRKITGLLLAGIMTISACACFAGAEEAEKNAVKSDETLKVGLASEPSCIWGGPLGKLENEASIISNCLMDRLVDFDEETGEIKPGLATSWEWVDEKHVKFTLRDDVMMSDGTPLVAEDVVYSIGIIAEYSANTDAGQNLDKDGFEVVDDHTVILAFNVVAPDLLAMMEFTNFGIVSEDEVNALGGLEEAARNPQLGCGRYRLKEWASGQYILLERNEDYWNPDYTGYFKEIKFTFVNDAASREMAVEAGNLDVAYDMPAVVASAYETSENVQTIFYNYSEVEHLFFNVRDGVCADQRVREAIALSLNYDAIASVGSAGKSGPATSWFTESSIFYHNMYEGEDRTPNPDKAKELLAEAGYPDGLTISTIVLQDSVPLYTVIQENLRASGITLELNNVDTAQFVESAFGGAYDLIVVGSNEGSVRLTNSYLFFQKDAFCIGGDKWTSDEISTAITDFIAESDVEKAKEISLGIEQILKDGTYTVPLYNFYKAVILANELKGFSTVERGWIDCTTLYK